MHRFPFPSSCFFKHLGPFFNPFLCSTSSFFRKEQMAIHAIHIITYWETLAPFDRMWFLSSVKVYERPRPCLLCKWWVHEWKKSQGEIKRKLAKGELHAKRQHGGVGGIRTIHFQACCKGWTLTCWLLPRCGSLNVVLKMACMPKHHRSLWTEDSSRRPFSWNLPPSATTEAQSILYAWVHRCVNMHIHK